MSSGILQEQGDLHSVFAELPFWSCVPVVSLLLAPVLPERPGLVPDCFCCTNGPDGRLSVCGFRLIWPVYFPAQTLRGGDLGWLFLLDAVSDPAEV